MPGPLSELDTDPDRLIACGVVPASGPGFAGDRCREVTATLTFGRGQPSRTGSGPATVSAGVLARQLLAGGTVVVGWGRVTADPGETGGPVRLEVPCDLSPARPPLVLCAAVRVLVPDDGEQPPVRELTGARLLISS